jgi:PAS domain S-box-containing protein
MPKNDLEQGKLEFALKESEEKYRDLFDNAIDCIYTIDLEGQFVTANKSVATALKCTSVEEVLGSKMSKWMTPESLEKALIFFKEVITEEDYFNKSVKIEIIRKDGMHVWFEHKARPIKDNNDNIIGLHGIARDITEKIKLEKDLKESEEKYRDLFENANDFIYTHDLKGTILNINKNGSQVLGATEEEIRGSNIREWLTPQSIEIVEDRIRKIFLNQPIEQPVVIEGITRKGERKWGEATTRLIKDGDRIVGVHGIFRDITERIRLQNALKESEEKYRDLFENAQDVMYVLDNELNFLKMNKIGIQTLGCTKEEVIGSNISRWATPESLKIIYERQQKRLSGQKVNPNDIIEIVCKNGEHKWAEIRSRVIRSDNGTIEFHGIARDITENRLLKLELNKSNKQQKLLCHLIQGTRGGKARALILKHLSDKSYNANELATALNMDYKTVRHHLKILIKNGIVGKSNDGSYDLYFILNNIDLDLNGITQNISGNKLLQGLG